MNDDVCGKTEQRRNFILGVAEIRKEKLSLREQQKLESGYWSFRPDSSASSNCRSNRSSIVDIIEIPQSDKQSNEANSSTDEIRQLLLRLEAFQKENPSQNLVGKCVERETFAAAFLTSEGGILKINEKQVILYVPPGAIPADTVQLVYVHITPPDTKLSALPAKEKWITAIADCGPSGIEFQRPVLLSLPRLPKSKPDGLITVRRSSTSFEDRWERLVDDDAERVKGTVLIKTTHFTRFGASQTESDSDDERNRSELTKWIKVAAFVKPSEKNDGRLDITVKLCDLKMYKEVVCEEGFAIPHKYSTPAPTLLVNSKSNVMIRLVDVKDTWRIIGKSEKILECTAVCSPYHRKSSLQTSVVFVAENLQSEAIVDFRGTIEAYQENNPEQTIGTLVQYPLETKDRIREDGIDEDTKFLMQQPDLDPSPHSNCFMKDRRFREICIILEGMNDVGIIERGWRSLAQAIGIVKYFTLSTIEGRARYQHKCPSAIVLDYFFSQYQNTKENAFIMDALRCLSDIFQDMENADAKRLIEEELSERCSDNSTLCTAEEVDDENCNHTVSKQRSSKKFSLDSHQSVNHGNDDLEEFRSSDIFPGQWCCLPFLKRSRHCRNELHYTCAEYEGKFVGLPAEFDYTKRDSGYGTAEPIKKNRRQKYSLSSNSIDALVKYPDCVLDPVKELN